MYADKLGKCVALNACPVDHKGSKFAVDVLVSDTVLVFIAVFVIYPAVVYEQLLCFFGVIGIAVQLIEFIFSFRIFVHAHSVKRVYDFTAAKGVISCELFAVKQMRQSLTHCCGRSSAHRAVEHNVCIACVVIACGFELVSFNGGQTFCYDGAVRHAHNNVDRACSELIQHGLCAHFFDGHFFYNRLLTFKVSDILLISFERICGVCGIEAFY